MRPFAFIVTVALALVLGLATRLEPVLVSAANSELAYQSFLPMITSIKPAGRQALIGPVRPTPEPAMTADDPVDTACFVEPLTGVFCIPDTTVQWGAESHELIDKCENGGWVPDKVSRTNDWGLWQINRPTHEPRIMSWGWVWEVHMIDPVYNGIYAKFLWDHQGWQPWSCRKWTYGVVAAGDWGIEQYERHWE